MQTFLTAQRREISLLFLVGACLSIAQFVMIRDFVTILYGEEVVIALVTTAFFTGLSIGYLLAARCPRALFERLFAAAAFLHLTFPFSYRYLSVWAHAGEWPGAGLILLLFACALLFNSMFAAFLPRLIDQSAPGADPVTRLKIFYTVELLGFIAGLGAVGFSLNGSLARLLPAYWLLLGLMLWLALGRTRLCLVYAAAAALAVFFLARLDAHSVAYLYEKRHGIKEPTVLASINSPYQKVDVIQDRRGNKSLYLDGLLNLNAYDLDDLNYFIATVPAAIMRPQKALIIGNGTLSSVPRIYPYAGSVTSVEIDPGVLKLGLAFFTPPTQLAKLDRWTLRTDDGKRFLATTAERYGLIIMDIPSPLAIQEACLHTVEFYRLAARRLSPTGIISIQLSGSLQNNNRTPARIMAALRQVFPEVMVVKSPRADRDFAYAANLLPFSEQQVRQFAKHYDARLQIINPADTHKYLEHATPLTIDSLDVVLKRGWERFSERYFDD